ncbi:MAG: PqiC family protein [Pseudomonadota bacterium]
MTFKRLLVFSGLTAGLGACASAPDPMLYTLAPSSPAEGSVDDGVLIGLSEIGLPSYARNQQITTARGPYRVTEDDDNRWARPPAEAISARMASVLEAEIGGDVLMRPYPAGVRPDIRLTVSFDRLLRASGGGAELAGQYIITGIDDEVQVDRFDIRVPAQAGDYEGYMQALADGLDRLCDQIAEMVEELD